MRLYKNKTNKINEGKARIFKQFLLPGFRPGPVPFLRPGWSKFPTLAREFWTAPKTVEEKYAQQSVKLQVVFTKSIFDYFIAQF